MKTPIAVIHRIILVALLFNLYSCRQETKQYVQVDPGFTSYISAFTSGYISNQAAVRIRLAEDFPEEIITNQALDEKVFRISPLSGDRPTGLTGEPLSSGRMNRWNPEFPIR